MMKAILFVSIFIIPVFTLSQQLQLHYDLRHSVDPMHNAKNFPSLYFEYFKTLDSGSSFIKPGSFLLKVQMDFTGERNNMGQYYMQVSQAFRFWRPKVFLQLQYSGGLGIAEPGAYGYYLINAFSVGVAYPFSWQNKAFFNVYSSYKYTAYKKTSHDIIAAFYWLRFFSNYKISFAGNLVAWTENRNHGDAFTVDRKGKKFSLFGDPQLFFSLHKGFSVGSKATLYYHVITEDNRIQVYPTIAMKYQF
ncbi:MAG TPA: DUF5020 family protein [Chitinophagaceae bacterium]|jgi:hypothetical protein|nr:DUF5020 family protein [Chitinophagaceae bacterium]